MKKNNFVNKSNDNINEAVNNAAKLSENELINKIIELNNLGFQNGSVDNIKLDEFANKASMYLDENQQKKLYDIVRMLKR